MERKSLSDLRQSFLSGRLYNQAEAMTKHYKTPILLIEFDRERAFALHSTAELGSDINVSAARTTLLSACTVKQPFRRWGGPATCIMCAAVFSYVKEPGSRC